MRRRITKLAMLICVPALLAGGPLEEVLAQLDAASKSFSGVQANVRKASYTAVIDDETVETGRMWMARQDGRGGGVRMRMDIAEPDVRSVAFSGQKAEIYYPNIKTVHEYDLGKHKSLIESFLLLGFGTTGKELAKEYEIKYVGEDVVEGVAAHYLELRPKSKQAREKIVKVDLWLAKDGAYPLRQKFYSPSNDTNTISYSDIELNPKLGAKELALDLPAGVKRAYPQK